MLCQRHFLDLGCLIFIDRFKGPTGVEMIVNCLPLYEPLPLSEDYGEREEEEWEEEEEGEEGVFAKRSPIRSASESSLSPRKSFSLVKAISVEALDTVAAELELHDHDSEVSKSDENLTRKSVSPRKWSRMSNSYAKNLTVMVHDVREEVPPPKEDFHRTGEASYQTGEAFYRTEEASNQTGEASCRIGETPEESSDRRNETEQSSDGSTSGIDTTERDHPQNSSTVIEEKERDIKIRQPEENSEHLPQASAVEKEEREGNDDADDDVVVKEKPPIHIQEPEDNEQSAKPKKKKSVTNSPDKKPLRSVKSASPFPEIENGSDEEATDGTNLTVNFLDSLTMNTIKRSSGSVSFISRPHPSHICQTNLPTQLENPDSLTTTAEETDGEAGILPTKPSSLEREAAQVLTQANDTPSAPPPQPELISFHSTPNGSTIASSILLASSLLPIPPSTLEPRYIERSGWLNKLSHRKGVFGDKWQKRYFVLHRSWLYYFKKYGVSELYSSTVSLISSLNPSLSLSSLLSSPPSPYLLSLSLSPPPLSLTSISRLLLLLLSLLLSCPRLHLPPHPPPSLPPFSSLSLTSISCLLLLLSSLLLSLPHLHLPPHPPPSLPPSSFPPSLLLSLPHLHLPPHPPSLPPSSSLFPFRIQTPEVSFVFSPLDGSMGCLKAHPECQMPW